MAPIARPAAAQDLAKEAGHVRRRAGRPGDPDHYRQVAEPDRPRSSGSTTCSSTASTCRRSARFVLGRYWRTATDPQKAEFLKLFEDMIVKTYNSRFTEYKGELFSVTGTRVDGDSAMVTTNVVQPNGRQAVKVDWRVLKPQGKLKIVDVIIEGVSMSVTQQQEFGSVIQRSGGQIDGLLSTMRERVQQQSQAAAAKS
ncbi:MAG: ABC transporter substrate-binding protein [Pseudomonadota bacterium]